MLCTIYTITFSNSGVAAGDVAMAGSGTNCFSDYITVSIHFIIQIRYDCTLMLIYDSRPYFWL